MVARDSTSSASSSTSDSSVSSQGHHETNGHSAAPDHDKGGEVKEKSPPGGFDTTPLPDAPQGYTVRFIIHSAANLPVADFHTGASDPYVIATLKGTNPKRHKEDPDLSHRTKTIRRSLEPVWNDEWVVANVPPGGFTIKFRMYDEDAADKDDRLGNVTIKIPEVSENWEGIPPPGREFPAKKRVMSKRAYLAKGIANVFTHGHMTPRLCISMEVLGKSDPPFAQMCTIGPTSWIKHFSPMIGRLIGTKVNKDEKDDENGDSSGGDSRKAQKYDFQASQMQLQGPVPSKLYHRYVEFRPVIGSLFASTGVRGKILNKALHKQHSRIYNFDNTTELGTFEPCSEQASLQLLKLAHFDEGGRIFTYILTLDGLLRFTETGKEFGVDMLSKHTMHADAEKYIACSGEFFIRRLQHSHTTSNGEAVNKTHPSEPIPGGPPTEAPPPNPAYYKLYIDNESGTYRPDKSIMPDLKKFMEKNFPGLGIVTMCSGDEELAELKEEQRNVKKREGKIMNVVMNRSSGSFSSVESMLNVRDETWEQGQKSKREAAYAVMMEPNSEKIKEAVGVILPHHDKKKNGDGGVEVGGAK